MAYSSSLLVNADNFQLIREVWPSSVGSESYVTYIYKRKVFTGATENYDSITGPIKRKSMIKGILKSDKLGGEMTPAQYKAAINDINSSLTL